MFSSFWGVDECLGSQLFFFFFFQAHDLANFCAFHLTFSLFFPSFPLSCLHCFLNSSLHLSLPLFTEDTLKFYLQASIR